MNPPPSPQSLAPVRAGLWSLSQGQRLRYLLAIVCMAIGIGLVFLVPAVTKGVIDGLPSDPGPFQSPDWLSRLCTSLGIDSPTTGPLMVAAICVVLLTVAGGAFQYLRGRLAAQAAEKMLERLRVHLYRHIQNLPAGYFDQADTGDIVQRCTSDVDTVRLFLSTQVVEIGRALLLVGCALPILFQLDVRLAWISLAVVPVLMVYAAGFFKSLTRYFRESDEAEGAMTAVLQENLTGIRVVRAFGRQDFEERKFDEANGHHRQATLNLMNLLSLFWSCSDFLCLGQVGLTLFAGGHFVLQGDMTLGTLVAFTQYSTMIIWPVRHMGRVLVDAGKARVSLRRLAEILESPEEQELREAPATVPAQPRGALVVRDLSFAYPGEKGPGAPVLQDLSFELQPGQTLALVGPPGSGKSTFVRLLLGLYDYTGPGGAGSIQLDGLELSRWPLRELRLQVSAVLQSPFLFAKTITGNLLVGRPGAAAEDLRQAAEAAHIHQAIEGFEHGYDTVVGERGVTLSGGQKQRMAIARALLKDCPLLLLDDALSAVDHATEQRIRQTLLRRAGRQSTVIISHRLTSVLHADQILVLREGRVVERGTHQELLARKGSYAHLWDLQSSYTTDSAEGSAEGLAQDPAGKPA
ncbi:MAG: ABC transporter ATP-binding protein [Planctomycetota bacterium]